MFLMKNIVLLSLKLQSAITAAMLFAAMAAASKAHADEARQLSHDLVTPSVVNAVRSIFDTDIVPLILEAQNSETATLDEQAIITLDNQWRAESEQIDQPLIGRILANPLSLYLTQIQARSNGLFVEIFVMDAKGLNAGQSAITSDYWQGDEAKFQRTFGVGPMAIFIDEAEFHDRSATWRAQVNLTLSDASGDALGAATVEVNLTELQRRLDADVWEDRR